MIDGSVQSALTFSQMQSRLLAATTCFALSVSKAHDSVHFAISACLVNLSPISQYDDWSKNSQFLVQMRHAKQSFVSAIWTNIYKVVSFRCFHVRTIPFAGKLCVEICLNIYKKNVISVKSSVYSFVVQSYL